MRLPRDHKASETTGWVKVARRFSNVVSPPVIFAVMALALTLHELPPREAIIWAAVYGFWVSLAPILLVVYLLRTGQITDLHMNTTQERRLPYISSVIGAMLALLIIVLFNGPELLRCLAIFSVIELATLAFITNYWMISIHSTSMSAATVITGLVFGLLPAILLLPLLTMVLWVRLYLRRHTVAQVTAGVGIGVLSVALVTFFGCFT